MIVRIRNEYWNSKKIITYTPLFERGVGVCQYKNSIIFLYLEISKQTLIIK